MTSHDRLAIRGLVADAGLDLDYPTCREMPETCQVADVGALVRGKEGRAITLAAIVQRARVGPEARWVNVVSHAAGFAVSVPIGELANAVVMYGLGDEPLAPAKGGPFRLLVPGHADECVHVKNVDTIEFAAERGRDTRPVDDAEHACLHAAKKSATAGT